MKYKLQVEKLKQIQMEKDLIKELEEENAKLVSENEDLVTDLFNTQARERSRKIDIELLKDRIKGLNKEIEYLKAENEKMKVGLFQRMETINDLDKELMEKRADIEDLEKENDNLRAENKDLHFKNDLLQSICLQHQELTQWIEEEIDNEPDTRIFEVSHDFLENLYERVHKLNHEPY